MSEENHPFGIPEWIRVDQDGSGMNGGFWTCAAATETSPKFIRADLCIVPTGAVIDRAAQHLRETLQGGKTLNEWSAVSKAAKKKWIALASGLFEVCRSTANEEERG